MPQTATEEKQFVILADGSVHIIREGQSLRDVANAYKEQ